MASVIGAFTVALQFFLWGYCFMMVGSVSWLLVGIKNRDSAMIFMNAIFFVANCVGLYKVI